MLSTVVSAVLSVHRLDLSRRWLMLLKGEEVQGCSAIPLSDQVLVDLIHLMARCSCSEGLTCSARHDMADDDRSDSDKSPLTEMLRFLMRCSHPLSYLCYSVAMTSLSVVRGLQTVPRILVSLLLLKPSLCDRVRSSYGSSCCPHWGDSQQLSDSLDWPVRTAQADSPSLVHLQWH